MSLSTALLLAHEGKLRCHPQFLRTPVDILRTICNGCGAANAKFDWIPDRIYGTSINEACNIHDFEYYFGKTEQDKEDADLRFLANLMRLIEMDSDKWYKPTMAQRRRALKYYEGVVYKGDKAYWKGKTQGKKT